MATHTAPSLQLRRVRAVLQGHTNILNCSGEMGRRIVHHVSTLKSLETTHTDLQGPCKGSGDA